ncbi:MAG: hypothetical protein M1818_004850 [Claussenomyces sp. TS43310]|nr:MAG: hypothetical protein M1818_004850 [Claussenomyces sp. TS43310]
MSFHHQIGAAMMNQSANMNQQIANMIPGQPTTTVPAQTIPPAIAQMAMPVQTSVPAIRSNTATQGVRHTDTRRARLQRDHDSLKFQVPKLADLTGTKRPLNSFIAFRSYYTQIFTHIQQKEASTYLTILWQEDPFKAKWTVIAKAWSIIRDAVGKPKAPLDKFLRIACPAIGIISAKEYLERRNWSMVPTAEGGLALKQTYPQNLNKLRGENVDVMMSEFELMQLAINAGYMPTGSEVFTNMNNNTHRILASEPGYNPSEAKLRFIKAAHNDPKAIAAHILGFDIDHPFLQVSSAPGREFVVTYPEMNQTQGYIEAGHHAQVPTPEQPSYKWTGSMAELYHPSEPALDFDRVLKHKTFEMTDLGMPAALDKYLMANGFESEFLQPNLPDDPSFQYSFWDSF